jgi:hypothetical protein
MTDTRDFTLGTHGEYINKQLTVSLWMYPEWIAHMEVVTKEFNRISLRTGGINVPAIASKKTVIIDKAMYDSLLILDVCRRVSPTRIEHWSATPFDDVIDALIDAGKCLYKDDYANTQLVFINDADECGVVACIFPGKDGTKRIQMSKI